MLRARKNFASPTRWDAHVGIPMDVRPRIALRGTSGRRVTCGADPTALQEAARLSRPRRRWVTKESYARAIFGTCRISAGSEGGGARSLVRNKSSTGAACGGSRERGLGGIARSALPAQQEAHCSGHGHSLSSRSFGHDSVQSSRAMHGAAYASADCPMKSVITTAQSRRSAAWSLRATARRPRRPRRAACAARRRRSIRFWHPTALRRGALACFFAHYRQLHSMSPGAQTQPIVILRSLLFASAFPD